MTARTAPERGPHPVSWFVGCVLVGWVVVYNIMRLSGSAPSGAAWISLVVGGFAGAAVFAAGLLGVRHLNRSGRVVRHGAADIPSPAEMTDPQRTLLGRTWPALAALAAVALVMGIALVAEWFGNEPGDRPTTLLVLAAWNILATLWVGDEAMRLRRFEADGTESVALGGALTAVLAGVGLARGYIEPGQVVLIVVGGVAGAAAAFAVWRIRGGRRFPVGAAVVAVVAALSLILPLTT